jgi:hypothetical protein
MLNAWSLSSAKISMPSTILEQPIKQYALNKCRAG